MKNVRSFWRIVVKVFCLVLLFIFYIGCEADIDIQENVNDTTNANFSVYLDLDPDMLCSRDGNEDSAMEIFFQANARFYTNVKVKDGRLQYVGDRNINMSKRLFDYLQLNLNETNIRIEKGEIEIIDSNKNNGFELVSTKIPVKRIKIKTRGFEGMDDDYTRIDFQDDKEEIGNNVINAMRQYFLNDVTDMRDLVDYDSTTWGQGGAIRSDYFLYNGNEVQWTVVNGTASTNYQREVYSICTDKCIEEPGYNNYEIQIRYCEGGTAFRLRTSDYGTYLELLYAVGAKK
ncbi:hypothetical protein BOVA514_4206 [Bacteroides ovatus]|uniref:hypothetical protein n=1 Tax=Bacteroides ovatus TaxID=28116 RepID=UPI0020A73EBA|nr:hypothetical protein [Bacteroides ovatus]CAG9897987.1 hypothetical protein BOVA514_4206 [Bacteroides ovatus]